MASARVDAATIPESFSPVLDFAVYANSAMLGIGSFCSWDLESKKGFD
jgi:hypothetical protein